MVISGLDPGGRKLPMNEESRRVTPGVSIGRQTLVFASVLAISVFSTVALPHWGARVLWFLPSGVAVAAVIRWGRGQWLPIFAAQFAIELIRGRAPLPSIIVAAGLPMGALVTAWILDRCGVAATFTRRRDVPLFIAACLIGMTIPALIGASTLAAFYPRDPADGKPWIPINILEWWLNDATGVLLLSPLLGAVRRSSFAPMMRQRLASALTVATLFALVLAIFLVRPLAVNPGVTQAPIIAVSIALIVFSRLRFDFVPTATAAVILALAEALALSFNLGAFVGVASLPGLVALWSYIGALICTMLMMTILLAEQERVDLLRRQAEVDLAAQAERNRLFLQNAGDGVHIIDEAGRIVEASNSFCAMLACSRSDLIGMPMSRIDAQIPPALHEESMDRIFGGEPLLAETLYRRHDGTVFDVEIRANGFEFAGNRYIYASSRDLTVIKTLQRALIDAISDEQRRLGQEMHDGLGQELTGMSLIAAALATQAERGRLPNAADLRALAAGLAHSIQIARGIVHGLSPLADSGGSLAGALAQLADSKQIGGVRVRFTADTEAALTLSTDTQSHLYRIAQEAVQNAQKHAFARHIDIGLRTREEDIRLVVADDGRGIHGGRPPHAGLGMNTMQYRASAIRGRLSIEARPEGGTVVSCIVPNLEIDSAAPDTQAFDSAVARN